ncbi:hypothetical protein C8U37_1106 [Trichococcus patagoniensis]|uniref:Uncharacterized protein n=1 Tax=Trichococcus patagoniensis TaxID=382641 RepID=A0A2T5IJU2_9LACT|nr:hypothetical protein C8U37_1106 [Trichococcus patagoniensis]
MASTPGNGCYRTTYEPYVLRLSDSSRLSDNIRALCAALVRFFAVIGQPTTLMCCACPILRGYRTTYESYVLRLSDSSRLSDNLRVLCVALVRFFAVIGQHTSLMCCACPILCGYRTTYESYALGLSDSLRLSDNLRVLCVALVRFFAVIGQHTSLMR